MFTDQRSAAQVVRSKGVHLRLRRDAIDGHSALIVPTGRSVLFVIPGSDHWLVGTTDTEWTQAPEAVVPTREDVDYLLGLLAGILARTIDPSEVTYAYAGLRPLVRDNGLGSDTAKLTREHRITRIAPCVLGIAGGKWTTYRVMARDLVDTVLLDSGLPPRPCRTHAVPLVASRESEVATLVERNPGLGQPLADAPGFSHADVVHAFLSEGAITVDDIVERRLRLRLHLDCVTDSTLRDIEGLRQEAAA